MFIHRSEMYDFVIHFSRKKIDTYFQVLIWILVYIFLPAVILSIIFRAQQLLLWLYITFTI